MEVQYFDDQLEEFIKNLEESTVAKVVRTVELLRRFGHLLGMPHSKKVGSHLYELRIHGKQKVRILYTFKGSVIMLLHGFIKKSSRIPTKELQTALQKLARLT
ncbi:type II toxin-antitoxin system RelE/ParE family toxin [Patescibacteria group bacterium]|nr:MAG: type II toxin-antitoxin system RelE/ParE family toxin [Patescibacteria group bacterium]